VNTAPVISEELREKLRAGLGRNAGHYLRHFERMQSGGRTWVPGWNFAAFVHSTGWFWYRRLYGWALLNLVAPLLLLMLLTFVVQWFVPEDSMGFATAAAGIAYLGLSFVLAPVYADSLYLYRLKRGGVAPRPPSSWTALGALLIIAIPALLVLATVSAQLEYAERARISEGISVASSFKAPVTEFYERQKRLPNAREEALFRRAEPMKHTASAGWDAGRGAIVATMGGRFKEQRIELVAHEKGGTLEWTCRPVAFEPKYLPASCR